MEINKNLVITNENGDYVIFNKETDKFYSLNQTTAFIWELISKNINEKEIVEKIENEYEIDKHTVEADLKNILQELKNEKILL